MLHGWSETTWRYILGAAPGVLQWEVDMVTDELSVGSTSGTPSHDDDVHDVGYTGEISRVPGVERESVCRRG